MKKKEAKSNYHWYEIEYKEDPELDDDELYSYFTYKGQDYFLHEFMNFRAFNDNYNDYWDGYINFTYDSGLVIKLSDRGDALQVGRFF